MRILIVLLCCMLFAIDAEASTFPSRPAAPAGYDEEQEVAILEVEADRLDDIMNVIQSRYSEVLVRRVYKTALYGLSVRGKRKELRALERMPGVIRATPVSVYKADAAESIPFIGGKKVRGYFDKQGRRLNGAGVKVGIIDTGIDYNHPDLRGNYGGGYDTVDGDADPMESQSEGATVHGSHVAGIVAANGKIQGVAPNARVIAYRALGPGGVGSTETVLAAIEQAIQDRVDVLNLSLGNEVNGPDWPTSTALNRATEKGIVTVTASGNAGPSLWTVGSPGTAAQSISVGASLPRLRIPYVRIHGKELRIAPLDGSAEWSLDRTYEYTFAHLGKKEDMKNVENKIVIVERGAIPFAEKVRHAEEAGAKAVLIYNNTPGLFSGKADGVSIPAAALSKEDGEWITEQSDPFLTTVFREEKDTIADFSSRGPVTATWDIKPDVVAPGVAITSTTPGGYMTLQGTSMAAPHVAGAAALLRQAHPDWSPEQVKAALMNTAKPLYHGTKLYHVYEQGAGRIQLERALHPEFLVYPSSLPYGLVTSNDRPMKRTVWVTIDNETKKVQTYTFSKPALQTGVQWHIPQPLQLGPEEKRRVPLEVELTPAFLERGVHEGHVLVHNSIHTVAIPYLFFVEEPDYPRIMGFQFAPGDEWGVYKYEVYVPGGADEMGIAIYDSATFRFLDFLDFRRDVQKGIVKRTIRAKKGWKGTYKALVFAKKGNREDTIEATVTFF